MDGKALVDALRSGAELPRPPYVPLLGEVALTLGQVSLEAFTTEAQIQARVLLEVSTGLHADVVTVGFGTDPCVGAEVVQRVRPLLGGRAVGACLTEVDVAGARAYCEAGVDIVLLLSPDRSNPARLRTLGKACAFYSAPVILIDPSLQDAAAVAAEAGLHGAVVEHPSGDEPGIVGGGLSLESLEAETLVAPRTTAFFWSFCGEVPAEATPEQLAALGERLGGS